MDCEYAYLCHLLATYITALMDVLSMQAPRAFADSDIYRLEIDELGTEFEETVHVNVSRNMEHIHVPQHNDVQETFFVIDYNRVTNLLCSFLNCNLFKTKQTGIP